MSLCSFSCIFNNLCIWGMALKVILGETGQPAVLFLPHVQIGMVSVDEDPETYGNCLGLIYTVNMYTD